MTNSRFVDSEERPDTPSRGGSRKAAREIVAKFCRCHGVVVGDRVGSWGCLARTTARGVGE